MDSVLVRKEEEHWFSETVIRVPGGRICFAPPSGAGDVADPPALKNGFITFGSFNNVTKISQDVVATWSTILGKLPSARLILKAKALSSPGIAEHLRSRFAEHHVSAERLELRGPSPKARLYAEYADIDIALDPFPFGGGVTSCDTLWMGVPLVTLPSWQTVSRQSESFLRAIGRAEWVAQDRDDYVRIAVDLAGDPRRLADFRVEQRQRLAMSPLCDKARIGRELGKALRQMWQAFVARNS
jgi:predicted O-linked N-acetylglucosamine transferase (SPINDLY family)